MKFDGYTSMKCAAILPFLMLVSMSCVGAQSSTIAAASTCVAAGQRSPERVTLLAQPFRVSGRYPLSTETMESYRWLKVDYFEAPLVRYVYQQLAVDQFSELDVGLFNLGTFTSVKFLVEVAYSDGCTDQFWSNGHYLVREGTHQGRVIGADLQSRVRALFFGFDQ